MEEEVVTEAAESTPDLEAKAREMGWRPEEEFTGDKTRWVDASTYIERGETILPLLQATNRRLREELSEQRKKLEELATARAQDAENLQALQESAAEMAKMQYKRALKSLQEKKAEAMGDGDHGAVVEIDEAISELRGKEPKEAPKRTQAAPAAPAGGTTLVDLNSEYFKAWKAENSWLDSDVRKTAYAVGATQDLHREGFRGRELLDKVTEEVQKMFGGRAPAPRGDKVEGSRGGAGTPMTRVSGKHSWTDIPADDRAVCDSQAGRLVGAGKIHKDLATWRASFTKQYFGE